MWGGRKQKGDEKHSIYYTLYVCSTYICSYGIFGCLTYLLKYKNKPLMKLITCDYLFIFTFSFFWTCKGTNHGYLCFTLQIDWYYKALAVRYINIITTTNTTTTTITAKVALTLFSHKKITQTFIPYTVPAYTTKRKHKICLNGINYVVLKNITMGKSVWATQFLSFILYYFHFHFSLLAC